VILPLVGPTKRANSAKMALHAAKSTADNLADKDIDSTETELRYAAYGARLRTALRAGHRYLAYVRTTFASINSEPVLTHLGSIRLATSEKPFDRSYLPP
jgi:hypothetical protein